MTDKSFYPIDGPWQNYTLRRFAKLHQEGKSVSDIVDDVVDPDCVTRLVPLVALYASNGEEMLRKVEESTLLMQSNDDIVAVTAVSARLIQAYILDTCEGEREEEVEEKMVSRLIQTLRTDKTLDPLQRTVASLLQQVLDNKHLTAKEATSVFGKD